MLVLQYDIDRVDMLSDRNVYSYLYIRITPDVSRLVRLLYRDAILVLNKMCFSVFSVTKQQRVVMHGIGRIDSKRSTFNLLTISLFN